MNYSIIKDEQKLREFIDWLPELKNHEQYYLCLFARSKYCKEIVHIKSDKAQLKRFTSTKERMFDKIRQLEAPLGAYKQYGVNKPTVDIPQEALALYISLNPRDLWRAAINSVIKLMNCIKDQNHTMNPHQEVMSEIQKAKSDTRYVHFDFDSDDAVKLNQELGDVYKYVNEESVTLVRTRGGVHVLVDPDKVTKPYKNTWYQKISKIGAVDQAGDMMIPVIGCTQGNFIPHFINLSPQHETVQSVSIPDQNSDEVVPEGSHSFKADRFAR